MADDDAPKWSVEEERLLHHETFVAEVLEKRRARDSERRPNPVWQRFLESAGGAALVTVIFGSIAAGLINSLVQEKLREREWGCPLG
jgi:anti-sigma factor RsiW